MSRGERDDEARRIVLARRARFLSATLAGIAGCTPAPKAPRENAALEIGIETEADAGAALDAGIEIDAGTEVDAGIEAAAPRAIVRVCLSIIVPPAVEFARGGSQVQPEAARTLDEVANTLAQYPDVGVEIEGHTDTTEAARVGQERADAVKRELVKRAVDPARMTTVNVGATQPIADEATAAGRARNRRTTFRARR